MVPFQTPEAVCDCIGSLCSLVTAMKPVTLKPPMGARVLWFTDLQGQTYCWNLMFYTISSQQADGTSVCSAQLWCPEALQCTQSHVHCKAWGQNNSGFPHHMMEIMELYGSLKVVRRKPAEIELSLCGVLILICSMTLDGDTGQYCATPWQPGWVFADVCLSQQCCLWDEWSRCH